MPIIARLSPTFATYKWRPRAKSEIAVVPDRLSSCGDFFRRRFAFSYASVKASDMSDSRPLTRSLTIFWTFSRAKMAQWSPAGPWPSKTPKKWFAFPPTPLQMQKLSWFAFFRSFLRSAAESLDPAT